jgi:hypothetical protein
MGHNLRFHPILAERDPPSHAKEFPQSLGIFSVPLINGNMTTLEKVARTNFQPYLKPLYFQSHFNAALVCLVFADLVEILECATERAAQTSSLTALRDLVEDLVRIQSVQAALELKKISYRLWNVAVEHGRSMQKKASDRQSASLQDPDMQINLESPLQPFYKLVCHVTFSLKQIFPFQCVILQRACCRYHVRKQRMQIWKVSRL